MSSLIVQVETYRKLKLHKFGEKITNLTFYMFEPPQTKGWGTVITT